MGSRKHAMLQRRQALLAKIAGQRAELAEVSQHWQPVLGVADQTLTAARFLRRNVVLVAGVAGLFLLRRNGVTALVKGGWRIWKTYGYFNQFINKMTSKNNP